jgi:hypothetical protein
MASNLDRTTGGGGGSASFADFDSPEAHEAFGTAGETKAARLADDWLFPFRDTVLESEGLGDRLTPLGRGGSSETAVATDELAAPLLRGDHVSPFGGGAATAAATAAAATAAAATAAAATAAAATAAAATAAAATAESKVEFEAAAATATAESEVEFEAATATATATAASTETEEEQEEETTAVPAATAVPVSLITTDEVSTKYEKGSLVKVEKKKFGRDHNVYIDHDGGMEYGVPKDYGDLRIKKGDSLYTRIWKKGERAFAKFDVFMGKKCELTQWAKVDSDVLTDLDNLRKWSRKVPNALKVEDTGQYPTPKDLGKFALGSLYQAVKAVPVLFASAGYFLARTVARTVTAAVKYTARVLFKGVAKPLFNVVFSKYGARHKNPEDFTLTAGLGSFVSHVANIFSESLRSLIPAVKTGSKGEDLRAMKVLGKGVASALVQGSLSLVTGLTNISLGLGLGSIASGLRKGAEKFYGKSGSLVFNRTSKTSKNWRAWFAQKTGNVLLAGANVFNFSRVFYSVPSAFRPNSQAKIMHRKMSFRKMNQMTRKKVALKTLFAGIDRIKNAKPTAHNVRVNAMFDVLTDVQQAAVEQKVKESTINFCVHTMNKTGISMDELINQSEKYKNSPKYNKLKLLTDDEITEIRAQIGEG